MILLRRRREWALDVIAPVVYWQQPLGVSSGGKMATAALYGGIEAGGTAIVCMIGTGPANVVAAVRFPTADPETLDRVVEFFLPYVRRGELAAVGIGSFGPVDLVPDSPTYGHVTTTPKPGWQGIDFRGRIQRELGIPVAFDTDVNAAAFGEHYWSTSSRGKDPLLYVTVGTGIGVGVLVHGRPLHGLVHPEAGHLRIPHDRDRDPFDGVCPFHQTCWEGLASGPAIARRWGVPAEQLPQDHPAWDLEAEYLAVGIANLIVSYSPQRIVLGGGVVTGQGLLRRLVRARIPGILNGYLRSPLLSEMIDDYLVAPSLEGRSGAMGAVAMAIELVRTHE
jgi:fructokinase